MADDVEEVEAYRSVEPRRDIYEDRGDQGFHVSSTSNLHECPRCYAIVASDGIDAHTDWHSRSQPESVATFAPPVRSIKLGSVDVEVNVYPCLCGGHDSAVERVHTADCPKSVESIANRDGL